VIATDDAATGLEEEVRRHWRLGLTVLIAAAIGNLALAPDWNAIQTAATPERFATLIDSQARVLASAACDIVFAAAYGSLGWTGARRWSVGRWAAIAAWSIAVGAAFDETENLVLVANVMRGDDVSARWLDVMRILGSLKYLAAPGVVLLNVFLVRAALRRTRTATE
jgi:hypothetical protein